MPQFVYTARNAKGEDVVGTMTAGSKREMLGASNRVVLLATGSKLTRTSSFRFADLEDIDDLVTTPDAPAALLDGFRAAGVAVHLAG